MSPNGVQLAAKLLRQHVADAHAAGQRPDVQAMVDEVHPPGFDPSVQIADIVRGHLVLGRC